jgi:hypothetical protein
MIDLATLQSLRARVAAASGPDREIDAAICVAFGIGGKSRTVNKRGHVVNGKPVFLRVDIEYPKLTASIDAARVLVERVLPGMVIECAIYPEGGGYACLWPWFKRAFPMGHRGETEAGTATPALAIILAMLDALIAKEPK